MSKAAQQDYLLDVRSNLTKGMTSTKDYVDRMPKSKYVNPPEPAHYKDGTRTGLERHWYYAHREILRVQPCQSSCSLMIDAGDTWWSSFAAMATCFCLRVVELVYTIIATPCAASQLSDGVTNEQRVAYKDAAYNVCKKHHGQKQACDDEAYCSYTSNELCLMRRRVDVPFTFKGKKGLPDDEPQMAPSVNELENALCHVLQQSSWAVAALQSVLYFVSWWFPSVAFVNSLVQQRLTSTVWSATNELVASGLKVELDLLWRALMLPIWPFSIDTFLRHITQGYAALPSLTAVACRVSLYAIVVAFYNNYEVQCQIAKIVGLVLLGTDDVVPYDQLSLLRRFAKSPTLAQLQEAAAEGRQSRMTIDAPSCKNKNCNLPYGKHSLNALHLSPKDSSSYFNVKAIIQSTHDLIRSLFIDDDNDCKSVEASFADAFADTYLYNELVPVQNDDSAHGEDATYSACTLHNHLGQSSVHNFHVLQVLASVQRFVETHLSVRNDTRARALVRQAERIKAALLNTRKDSTKKTGVFCYSSKNSVDDARNAYERKGVADAHEALIKAVNDAVDVCTEDDEACKTPKDIEALNNRCEGYNVSGACQAADNGGDHLTCQWVKFACQKDHACSWNDASELCGGRSDIRVRYSARQLRRVPNVDDDRVVQVERAAETYNERLSNYARSAHVAELYGCGGDDHGALFRHTELCYRINQDDTIAKVAATAGSLHGACEEIKSTDACRARGTGLIPGQSLCDKDDEYAVIEVNDCQWYSTRAKV